MSGGTALLCADIGNSPHRRSGSWSRRRGARPLAGATDETRTADEWAVLIRGLLPEPALRAGRHRRHRRVLDGARRCCTSGATCSPTTSSTRADGRRRARRADRRTGADGQPARGRRRPDRQRPRRRHLVRRAGDRRRLRHRHHLRRGQPARASTSAARSRPGIDISLEALGRRGAQLRKVELLRPRSVIAKNTVEALQSGMVFGFASQVDGIVGADDRRARRRPGDGQRRSRPAAWPRSWSTSAAPSPTTSPG